MSKIISFLLLAVLLLTMSLIAQQRMPQLSPAAKVSQTIGMSEIDISYHRPGVRGREIWGNVVKYDEVWRAGANEPTLVTLSDEATIEGKKLGAGTYRFVVIPSKTSDWTIIFNSETKNWGTVYNEKYDTLKFTVKPEFGTNEEWMSFSVTDLTPFSGRVVLAWEKVRLSFKVEFNTIAKVRTSVESWQLLYGAARFTLENKVSMDEGLVWIERSIALDKNQWNVGTKAELLAQTGKPKEAIASAEEAVKIAKAKNPKADTSYLEKMIEEWKKK